jgi:hypothetical protein
MRGLSDSICEARRQKLVSLVSALPQASAEVCGDRHLSFKVRGKTFGYFLDARALTTSGDVMLTRSEPTLSLNAPRPYVNATRWPSAGLKCRSVTLTFGMPSAGPMNVPKRRRWLISKRQCQLRHRLCLY